jgi:putative transposase
VTVVREPDNRFYVSFVVDEPAVEAAPPEMDARPHAGVDVGLIDIATVVRSDGTRTKLSNPRWARTRAGKLARAQRAYARTQKGSNNRQKARQRVAVQHRKTREARADHHHKVALQLVRENQTVALETLNLNGLARTRLAKSFHDAGLGLLVQLIVEKAPRHHTVVVRTGRWEPTTQTCSVCGTPGGKKPLSVRAWTCTGCAAVLDRDFNAAVNIMVAAGLAETLNACGGSVRRRLAVADPVKQEPTEQTPPQGAAA